MKTYGRPAIQAPGNGQEHEYEFIPSDPAKPIYYGVCTQKEAGEHADAANVSMYRKIK